MRVKAISLVLFLVSASLLSLVFTLSSSSVQAAPQSPTAAACQARYNNGVTDSSIFSTLQGAINAASAGNLIKVTGYCKNHFADQVAYINKDLTVRGGYNPGDWTTIDLAIYPTTLDAYTGTYGIYVYNATAGLENLTVITGTFGIYNSNATVLITKSTVMSTTTAGIYSVNSAMTMTNGTVKDNAAEGFIATSFGSAVIINSDIHHNASNGASATSIADITIISSTLHDNGFNGAAARSFGNVTIISSTLHDNAQNGATSQSFGAIIVMSSTVYSNTGNGLSAVSIGGITVTNSTIRNNGQNGIFNGSISNETFVENSALHNNGGSGFVNDYTAKLINVTSANNVDGGIVSNGYTLTLMNTTVASNAFGVSTNSGVMIFRNTLLTQNGVFNCSTPNGQYVSDDYNLSSDNSPCNFNQPNDLADYAAPIGLLQNNGGSTWTMLPASTNPAIDHGACDLPKDQRGQARPNPATPYCDIGATEGTPTLWPDLRVYKTESSFAVAAGKPITYFVTFKNTGTLTASHVVLTDIIPSSLTNLSYISSGPTITRTAGITYAWTLGNLPVGATGRITIMGIISPNLTATYGYITNTAIITNDIAPWLIHAIDSAIVTYPRLVYLPVALKLK